MGDIRETQFLQSGNTLSITSDEFTTGYYYNQNPGEEPSGYTSVSASSTINIIASIEDRYFIFETTGSLTFSIVGSVGQSDEQIQDLAGGMHSGNTETGIVTTYQEADGTIDFIVADLTVEGDSGSTAMTPGDTLTIAGGTSISTAISGDTITITSEVSPGWVHLETLTASASPSLDFETAIDSTYEDYVIVMTNLRAATATAVAYLRIGVGETPTYKSGASDYGWTSHVVNNTGTVAATGDNADTEIELAGGTPLSDSALGSISGEIRIVDPASATSGLWCHHKGVAFHNTSGVIQYSGSGLYGATQEAITAFQILMSTGNITSGVARLYGVTKG